LSQQGHDPASRALVERITAQMLTFYFSTFLALVAVALWPPSSADASGDSKRNALERLRERRSHAALFPGARPY